MLYINYLDKLQTCPFCAKKGRVFIKTPLVYLSYAKAPYHPHHLLVIPIRHVESFFELKSEEKKDIEILLAKAAKILKKLKYINFTILVREGTSINKSIKHLHYHIIPNDRIGDLDHKGEKRKVLSPKEIKLLNTEISSIIKQSNLV